MSQAIALEKDIKKQLKQAGYKMTPQRQATVAVLCANQTTFLTAEKIFMLAKAISQDIGLATVYRTLEILVGCQIVTKSASNEAGIIRYQLAHAHQLLLVCKNCGRVIDLDNETWQSITQQIQQQVGFKIQTAQADLEIEGLCANCLKQRQTKILT
ncbi:Fur family transcriptional regulator [Agrilactobacillus fermenti]|uniref:Fur family transcriptional regulator n=1 Tax=Agrilactobacillus fermenti TaxID=2586909 RepID=UPI003A5C1523